jgi:hypothetical protein
VKSDEYGKRLVAVADETVPVPRVVAPSMNVTVPVGRSAPVFTRVVKVTLDPTVTPVGGVAKTDSTVGALLTT